MGKHFNTRIREARERVGLSQAGLAEKFGVTGPTISNWENRESTPRDELHGKVLDWVDEVERAPELQQAPPVDGSVRNDGNQESADLRVSPDRQSSPVAVGEFAESIRRRRIKNAWSQSELAEKLGVAQTTISNWENAKGVPDRPQRQRLQEVLGLQVIDRQQDATNASDEQEHGESAGPAAFGTWLNRTRLERKLSVAELALKADVSRPAVYNIESGRIENPRAETVRRLERALGSEVPAETKKEIREEATVKGVGEFVEFDPNDHDDWPEIPGIYVLYDISERPIYVGQGANIKRRIQDHFQKFWFKSPIVETAACIKIEDASLREKIETIFIRFLKRNAVINKQNVER